MSTYDFNDSEGLPGWVLGGVGLVLAGLLVGGYLYLRAEQKESLRDPSPVEQARTVSEKAESGEGEVERLQPSTEDLVTPPDSSPAQLLADLEEPQGYLNPAMLMQELSAALEGGEVEAVAKILGPQALNEQMLTALAELIAQPDFALRAGQPTSEIGELETRRKARWALNLEDRYASRIYFDLVRREDGRWEVELVRLPPASRLGEPAPRATLVDALGIVDGFLQAVLQQKFEDAKLFADPAQVSDASIAGLCIIFEEGRYRLREQKPLSALFRRDTTAGFRAHVEGSEGASSAFSLLVQRESPRHPWQVVEMNFDQLLGDYARWASGGEVFYTPLIRQPQGGDRLILYFAFDDQSLTPRSQRQLDIVANLLRTDESKKLTISGHTDALGTESYNEELSAQRAQEVKDYLVQVGVLESQIITAARGSSDPRQPNTTPSGEDNPQGRQANRRTEIYLEF